MNNVNNFVVWISVKKKNRLFSLLNAYKVKKKIDCLVVHVFFLTSFTHANRPVKSGRVGYVPQDQLYQGRTRPFPLSLYCVYLVT